MSQIKFEMKLRKKQFTQQNVFENVVFKVVAILFKPRCVKQFDWFWFKSVNDPNKW